MSEALEQAQAARPRRFRPYREYKDSRVEWLGEIPAHWDVGRLKYLATVNDEVLPESTAPSREITYVDIGSVDAIKGVTATETLTFEKAPSRARRIVRHGDVIVSTVRTYLRAIAAIENPDPNLIVSTGFAVIRPRYLDSSFASYALRAPWFVERVVANSVGVSYPAINPSDLAGFPVASPDLDEERAIAAFLDRETAKIDALVARKERLIELLQEKRSTLTTRAVTRGLDPNVPVKPSGIDWLGDIPAHWRVWELRHLLVDPPRNGLSPPITPDGTVPTFSVAAIADGKVDILEHLKYADVLPSTSRAFEVRRGDVLALRGNGNIDYVARAGIVEEEPPPGCIYPDILIRLRPDKRLLITKYAVHLLNSAAIRPQIRAASRTSAGIWKISGARLGSLRLPIPPDHEQDSIVRAISDRSGRISVLIDSVRRALSVLVEYRTALISAAVTGRIDVREHVA